MSTSIPTCSWYRTWDESHGCLGAEVSVLVHPRGWNWHRNGCGDVLRCFQVVRIVVDRIRVWRLSTSISDRVGRTAITCVCISPCTFASPARLCCVGREAWNVRVRERRDDASSAPLIVLSSSFPEPLDDQEDHKKQEENSHYGNAYADLGCCGKA